jgi:peptide/nickel transport system permease protein
MSVLNPLVSNEPPLVQPKKPSGVIRNALKLGRTRVGLVLLVLIAGIAVFGPLFAPHGPQDYVTGLLPSKGPAPGALFGTDYIGQDVWSRFLDGGREILLLALASTILGLALGVAIGLFAAYTKGASDDVLMRGMDVILAFPSIMLALVVIATLGPSYWLIILAVGLTNIPRVARVTRAAAQPIVERDFVGAAEAIGVPRWKILFGEILPNVLSPLMVEGSLRLTYSIGLIAAIAFLGFTPNPNGADWGVMIQENRLALSVQPWGVVLPVLAIALLTMATGMIGDGIARAAAGIDRLRTAE